MPIPSSITVITAALDETLILPILLGLVDLCQNSELREQSAAALSRKENPVRLWCSSHPSADQKQLDVLRTPSCPPWTKRC